MQGGAIVIQHLNTVLKNELTATNQYFLHARMLRHWGVAKLAAYEYNESIDEMKHADLLIERILFLGGVPRMALDQLFIGETVPGILDCDLRLERLALVELREAIAHCENVRDFVSRDLFATILREEETQLEFIETQLGLIPKIGLENFIQLQSAPAT